MSYTFFGIQVVVKAYRKDPLRRRLHEIIQEGARQQSLVDKRVFWKRITAVLNEQMPVFEMGYWDLVRGGSAEEEFETWTSEIEGSVASEQDELGEAADEVNRLSADRDYVVVSMFFLLEQGSNSDVTLGDRCDLPEREYWTRPTFARLIASIPLLNFANVKSDAIYLVPGNEDDGLSRSDLQDEGWSYLKELS